jgi:DNA-binding IclR family transcriptional regulator
VSAVVYNPGVEGEVLLEKAEKAPHGVQSADTVLEVLSAFIGAESLPLMLKTIAERTKMHPAKVHRYLVSLCRLGFIEQDEQTSRYRFGPSSLQLAFAALGSIDCIRVARLMMADFCNRLQQTVVLAVWNAGRPTIAVRETLPALMTMTASEGFTTPIVRSSIGNVFAAYLPENRTLPLIKQEIAEGLPTSCPQNLTGVKALLAEVRRRGLARTTGQLVPHSHSFAAPVFDVSGALSAVLCTLGPAGMFDSRWNSPIAAQLMQCAMEMSHRLGYQTKIK